MSGPRSRVRRLLDVWGFTPGFAVPHRDVRLVTRDDVALTATYLPGPAAAAPAAEVPAVVLAHGFAGHRRKPAYAYLAETLADVGAVLSVDLRGHGDSGGACTLGDREVLDLRAAAAWLRRHGHRWVGVIGASMGGSAALGAAGGGAPGVFDAVAAISAPAVWGLTDTPAMQALTRALVDPRRRRVTGLVLRVRIGPCRWPPVAGVAPAPPLAVVARIAPTPLLVVHGVDDHYYGIEQAERLVALAGHPATLWREPPGFGHAEDGFSPAFARRLAAAVAAVAREGRWPAADALADAAVT